MIKLKNILVFFVIFCLSAITISGFVLFVPDTNAGSIPRIVVVNNGSEEQTNITVHYVIPDNFTGYDDVGFSFEPSQGNVSYYTENDGIQIDWNVGDLAPGENATLDIIVWTDYYSEDHGFDSVETDELEEGLSITSDQTEDEEELRGGGGGGGAITAYATSDADGDGIPNNEEKEFAIYFKPPENCGDGIVDADEECDDKENNGVRCNAGYGISCNFCSEICTYAIVYGNHCGDSKVNGAEECDDGNSENNDRCRNDCTLNSCSGCSGKYIVQSCDECLSTQSCMPSYGCIDHEEYEACANGFVCEAKKETDILMASIVGIIIAAVIAVIIIALLIKGRR